MKTSTGRPHSLSDTFSRIILERLGAIREKKSAFSLRSYSRVLGISHSALSEIIRGKRRVSAKTALRVAQRAGFSRKEIEELLSASKSDLEGSDRRGKLSNSNRSKVSPPLVLLNVDQYSLISEWQHFAILSLLETRGAKSNPRWIASRLGISIREAQSCIERLIRGGILSASPSGELMLKAFSFSSPDGVSVHALRSAHRGNLTLAERSLNLDPLDQRDFCSITMAIDPARLPEAKRRIRQFRDELSEYLEGGEKVEVYKLCMQLFPLSRSGGEKHLGSNA